MDAITKEILALFEEINAIPRCSGHEENIANWLKEQALSAGLGFKFDSVNNVLISVPASPGYETLPAVILQGHMDMVCEKTQASAHDFSRDPISHIIEGDWLRADGTTLGADNGIALAMALVLARHRKIPHPPLELLFTVDEETGLTGANELMPDFISGKILLNLDSEEEGVFITGCAGGLTTTISLPLERAPLPASHKVYRLAVTGLAGGHSGVNIHEKRANANKLLAAVLGSLMDNASLHILSISGGSAHNAISRHAEALVGMPLENIKRAEEIVMRAEEEARRIYAAHDTSLSVTLSIQQEDEGLHVIPHETAQKILSLLNELPHGVARMSADMPGLVQASSNLAVIRTEGDQLVIITSQRSSASSELQEITGKITSTARSMGAEVRHGSGYPAWQPDPLSPLTRRCKDIYSEIFAKEPAIEVIHAGLECAVIGSKYPGMEMISFGPTIRNPHSPEERLYIPSVPKVWKFLIALLASFR
ncbi:aminoacyl-histidine dipeptidase [Methanolobus chelungpuianus]|uniref:Aminoacyl-histidine dipeptidase n=1 Tax=Methanolobus chelungpuianus TaxID=502115 RepID=A0AAE3HC05_9EURY|nr:aminoacyl-histidine dipeptidase [Methanolobus chelungpuianus]MCQ6963344.1 aminoacyl-histidine dipeptidase [Methanolobus chelungpuianus]